MLCDAPQSRINLGRILGRDIIDLQPIAAQTQDTAISPELPMLDGLHRSQINSAPGFFSIVHRQVKQAMAWKPVQWAGICIGLIVLVGLSGEHFLLRRTLVDAGSDYRTVQQQIIRDAPEMALSEYSSTLEQMLDMAEQSVLVDTVHQLPAGFPAHVQLKELDLDLESTPRMKISARVHAHDAVELQTVLIRLIDQLKVKLKSAQAMTLNDIDIRLEQPATGITPNRYQIAFQLELL